MGYAENIVVFTLNFIVMQVEPLTVKIKLKEILLPYFFFCCDSVILHWDKCFK